MFFRQHRGTSTLQLTVHDIGYLSDQASTSPPLSSWLCQTAEPSPPVAAQVNNIINDKSARRRCKHCALAVVRRSQKISPHRRSPSQGRGTAKI